MKASIIATEGGRTITNPSAEDLSRWASQRHAETCPQCRRGDEFCPVGDRLYAATRPDTSWIRDYEGGA